ALQSFEDNIESHGKDTEINYYFAMADALETLGEYERSFEYLEKASALKLKISPPTELEQGLKEKLELRRELYAPKFIKTFSGKVGYKSDIPVFVVGMPRSGTTLTEQIIAAHPEAFGAGELNFISQIAQQIAAENNQSPELLTEVGKQFVEDMKKLDPTGKAKRITDKMPGNCMNLGLICMAMPD
ncbi:MAG: sulfotransferase, partial [Phycisphaerales bacterium]|nr:sulfotransferase [Phycisphaerales bacterium]